jgi:hypothetical protein
MVRCKRIPNGFQRDAGIPKFFSFVEPKRDPHRSFHAPPSTTRRPPPRGSGALDPSTDDAIALPRRSYLFCGVPLADPQPP